MSDPPSVSTQDAAVTPGGTAVLRPFGIPDVPPATPDPTRKITPDATGYYEADPLTPAWNSNRLLHLNQAGHALVGWFTAPPQFVQPRQDFPVYVAVLVADLDPKFKSKDGFQFSYREVASIEGIDPNYVLSPLQPWNRNEPPPINNPQEGEIVVRPGMIAIEPASDSWDFLSQKAAVTLTFTLGDGSTSAPIRFIHKQPSARVAERTIACQETTLKRALIARHRHPIPSTFFDTSKPCGGTWKSARLLFDPDPGGPLAQEIRFYQADADSSGPGGYAGREIALSKIATLLSFPWDATDHAQLLNLLLTREALNNDLTIKGTTKSYREWLSGIAANEVAMHKKYAPPEDTKKDNDKKSDDKGDAGNQLLVYTQNLGKLMAGAKMYRYDLSFSTKAKDKQILPLVKGAAGLFSVTISVLSCDLPKTGILPSDDQFKGLDAVGPANFNGAFFELKGGFGGPPELPEKISVYSGTQLASTDFDGAFFEIYALDASASVSGGVSNPVMKISLKGNVGGATQLIRVHVKGVVLEGASASGSVVPTVKLSKGFTVPDWGTIKKIFSTRGIAEDSDFIKPTGSKSASVGACLGLGYIALQRKFAQWLQPPPRAGSAWQEGGDARTIDACFDRDSADFTKKQVNGWDVRFLLETVLATDLALLNGVPNVDVEGFASPEYTPQHNLILSRKRANAVLQAILDAVGPLSPDATTAIAHGDAQAMAPVDQDGGGLADPDPSGSMAERVQFEKEHPEQVSQWPQWRKVTIDVRGHFAVHVITVGDDAG